MPSIIPVRRNVLHRAAPPVVVAAGTTWDSAHKFQISLSNGDLTATNSFGVGQFGIVRGIASHSTGKFYCEWHVDAADGQQMGIGICNASQTFVSGQLIGSGANNAGTFLNGEVHCNGVTLGLYNGVTLVTNDLVSMAIDIGGALGWWRVNAGNWNNSGAANPATGVGGYSISAVTGTLFLFAELESTGTISTLNTGGSAYAQSVPSFFGNW